MIAAFLLLIYSMINIEKRVKEAKILTDYCAKAVAEHQIIGKVEQMMPLII